MTTYGPIFSTRNYVTDVSQLMDDGSNLTAQKKKLNDKNPDFQWETFVVSPTRFLAFIPTTKKEITIIAIQNCNWKTFSATYRDDGGGGNAFSPAISVTDSTLKDFIFIFDAVTINSITFTISATHTVGDTVKAGQLYVGNQIYEVPATIAGDIDRPDPQQKSSIIELSDGTFNNIYVRSLINWELALKNVTAGQRTSLKAVYDYHRRGQFFFIPRPATAADNWDGIGFHGIWANGPDFERFTEDHMVSGYDVNISIAQGGGVV